MRLSKITNIKLFMNKLLIENAFDSFLISEAIIKTGNTFVIDGHINEGFYSAEEISEMRDEALNDNRIFSEKLSRFIQLKPFILSTIKGKKTPSYFKFSFYLALENVDKLLALSDTTIKRSDIDGLSLIVKFSDSELTCTSSISLNIFTTDKSIDKIWDDMVLKFLSSHSIQYEVM